MMAINGRMDCPREFRAASPLFGMAARCGLEKAPARGTRPGQFE